MAQGYYTALGTAWGVGRGDGGEAPLTRALPRKPCPSRVRPCGLVPCFAADLHAPLCFSMAACDRVEKAAEKKEDKGLRKSVEKTKDKKSDAEKEKAKAKEKENAKEKQKEKEKAAPAAAPAPAPAKEPAETA